MTLEKDLNIQLEQTSNILDRYGFKFWAEKLKTIQKNGIKDSQHNVLIEIAKLYGGFGTLMDLAVDPCVLSDDISENEANHELLCSINKLYEFVKHD